MFFVVHSIAENFFQEKPEHRLYSIYILTNSKFSYRNEFVESLISR
jgi:hypothetical protein